MLYGAIILGRWGVLVGIKGKFCKRVLRNSRNAAKGRAGSESQRDSRRGEILRTAHTGVM